MPTYEYRCPKCTFTAEKQIKIDERYTPQICGYCDVAMIMKIPKIGLQFRGSGFYETDYKGK